MKLFENSDMCLTLYLKALFASKGAKQEKGISQRTLFKRREVLLIKENQEKYRNIKLQSKWNIPSSFYL